MSGMAATLLLIGAFLAAVLALRFVGRRQRH